MKWFLVKYFYQIISGDGNYNTQFDEQLRLIIASSANDALKKAEDMADGFQPPFKNCNNEMVTWKFICVADIHEIQMPEDGAEVASILHEPNDVASFLDAIAQRKAFLKQHIENEFTLI
ncbi:MAG TPA: DUF4288 domain-containing protein [Pedobacter sp.]|nr:DUF4288 domain-containing protein [Pedobacter sp.]